MKLNPDIPDHACLIALKDDNREKVDLLDRYGLHMNVVHVLDVKFGILLNMVFPGDTSKARVAFELQFEAFMNEEMERTLAEAEKFPIPDPVEPPKLRTDIQNIKEMVAMMHPEVNA